MWVFNIIVTGPTDSLNAASTKLQRHHYSVSGVRVFSLLYKFIDCGFLISKWQGTASSWQGLVPGPPLATPLIIINNNYIYA